MGLLRKTKVLFLKAKDISGERLLEHLKNIGIEAEKIATGSADDPAYHLKNVTYSFSIRVKGLNIDVIQLNFYYGHYSFAGYRIDYIVRGYERDKRHLRKRLEGLGDSIWSKILFILFGILCMKKKVEYVKADEINRCVRMYLFSPLLSGMETIVVEEGGKRVKYEYLKDTKLPSRETIEAYDRLASHVRSILEGG